MLNFFTSGPHWAISPSIVRPSSSCVLPHGSTEDVHREVERRIEELGCGGGYVLGAVHNIQPDVPPENVLAMYRHAREYVPSFAG